MLDWCLQLKVKYVLALAVAVFLSYYFFGLFTPTLVAQWHIAIPTSRFYPIQVKVMDNDNLKLYAVTDDDHFYHFLITLSRRPLPELLPEILPVHALALPSTIRNVKAFDVKIVQNIQILILLCENGAIFALDDRFNIRWRSEELQQKFEGGRVDGGFVQFLPNCLAPDACDVVLVGGALRPKGNAEQHSNHGKNHEPQELATIAFDAFSGRLIWEHLPTDEGRELENENERLAPSVRHHWKLKLLRSHLRKEHVDSRPWVSFLPFFLEQLPHAWVGPQDTSASLAALSHHRLASSSARRSPPRPNVLVVRHGRGLQVLDLFSGKARSQLELQTGPGRAFYRDASRLSLAYLDPSQNETSGSACSLRLVPRSAGAFGAESWRPLASFDSACAPVGFFDSPRPRHRNYREDPAKLVPPLVVQRSDFSYNLFSFFGFRSQQSKDIISLASDGILSSYSSAGHENWRVRLPISWLPVTRDINSGELASEDVRERYHRLFLPSLSRLRPEDSFWGLHAALATGWNGLAAAELSTGRLLAFQELPCQPIHSPVVVNGHVLVICHSMILGFSMTFALRFATFLAALSCFSLTALFLVCCLDPKSLFWDLLE